MSLSSSAKNGQSGTDLACLRPAGQLQDTRQENGDRLPTLKCRERTAQPCCTGWCSWQMAGWYWRHSDYIEGRSIVLFAAQIRVLPTQEFCVSIYCSRLVQLVYSIVSTALWSTHIPWQELKEHFQQPPITALITRDYHVPQNRPQAFFCMQTTAEFLVHAGRALFRISPSCSYISHHCQLPLNNGTLKHCCACGAHAFQKASTLLSELPIWRFWKHVLMLILMIRGFFLLLLNTWPFMC